MVPSRGSLAEDFLHYTTFGLPDSFVRLGRSSARSGMRSEVTQPVCGKSYARHAFRSCNDKILTPLPADEFDFAAASDLAVSDCDLARRAIAGLTDGTDDFPQGD